MTWKVFVTNEPGPVTVTARDVSPGGRANWDRACRAITVSLEKTKIP